MLQPGFELIQLKRTSATQIDNVPGKGSYRIGAEIPPVRYLTVELQMGKWELISYARLHAVCVGNLGIGYNDDDNTGMRKAAQSSESQSPCSLAGARITHLVSEKIAQIDEI